MIVQLKIKNEELKIPWMSELFAPGKYFKIEEFLNF
jgi:hypothetical protein